MEAIACTHLGCEAVGTPMTMRWVMDDYAPDTGPSYAARCDEHAGTVTEQQPAGHWFRLVEVKPPTMREVDEEPMPTDDDLLDWVDTEGVSEELFVDECVEASGLPDSFDWIPTPDGEARMTVGPTFDDVPERVRIEVARVWWADGRIDWVLDEEKAGQERTMSLRVVGTTTRRSKA